MTGGRFLKQGGLEISEQPSAPPSAAIPPFTVPAETAAGIEKIRAVDPNHAGFELRRNVQRNIDALANNTVYGLAARVWSESINVSLPLAPPPEAPRSCTVRPNHHRCRLPL